MRGLAVVGVGVVALAMSATLTLARMPQPRVHDEFANLLAADFLRQGRASGPTHPLWVHFETFHVLHEPRHASKYPPAPAALMAIGWKLTGHPIVGSWLSVALGASAVCWMLQGWTRPRWAFLGGLLVALHRGIHGGIDAAGRDYAWSQGYWGGGVALVGGALVLGAVERLVRHDRARDAAWFGLGTSILAASRPFEGVLLVACCGAYWIFMSVANGQRGLRGISRALSIAMLAASPGFLLLGAYHRSVTGSIWRMPYSEYEARYDPVPVFVGLGDPGPRRSYNHRELDRFYNEWCRELWSRRRSWAGWWAFHAERLRWAWKFYVGPLVLPALCIPVAAKWGGARVVFATLACALGVGAHGLTMGLHPHYLAPMAPAFVHLLVLGIRWLALQRIGAMRVGRVLVGISLASLLLTDMMLVHARRFSPTSWEETRARIDSKLGASGERHLVITRYGPEHDVHAEWVWNAADIEAAPVVWAREMEPARMDDLLRHFAERRVWLVEADAPRPVLVPHAPGSARTNDSTTRGRVPRP